MTAKMISVNQELIEFPWDFQVVFAQPSVHRTVLVYLSGMSLQTQALIQTLSCWGGPTDHISAADAEDRFHT